MHGPPETGPAVEIPLADIVTGKPVPPRASVRQRVSARDAERHSLPLWPFVERVAAAASGSCAPTRRRSAGCSSAPTRAWRSATRGCLSPRRPTSVREFYDARGRDALVQVELGSEPDSAFADLGWTAVAGW